MNISTNQVSQMYVCSATPTIVTAGDSKSAYLKIGDERTDLIPHGQVLSVTRAFGASTSEQLIRKALNVKIASNCSVAGQDYILTLTYRGNIGEEDTYHKFAEFHSTTSTAADIVQGLASSLIKQRGVEPYPLYDLMDKYGNTLVEGTYDSYDSTTTAGYKVGAVVKNSNIVYRCKTAIPSGSAAGNFDSSKWTKLGILITTLDNTDGFWIVEPVPYYKKAVFPETLMNISMSTPAIIVSGDEVEKWLVNYKFTPRPTSNPNLGTAVPAIRNNHKIMDLEYFCKGERGLSAPLHTPYVDQIDPNFKVTEQTYGYDVCIIHYAFVGDNASNQKSEKTIILVAASDNTTTASNSKFTDTFIAAVKAI